MMGLMWRTRRTLRVRCNLHLYLALHDEMK